MSVSAVRARRSVLLLAALGLVAACGGSSAGTTGSPSVPSAGRSAVPPTLAGGTFDTVRLRVFDADGIECGLCMWRADDSAERARGLMRVTDLQGAHGMVFAYEGATESAFWMKDTVLALSIAYYAADGTYVGAQDMDPCVEGETCPTYAAPGPFAFAVEVPQGRLADLGLVPGSRVQLGEPCTPEPAAS